MISGLANVPASLTSIRAMGMASLAPGMTAVCLKSTGAGRSAIIRVSISGFRDKNGFFSW